MKKLVLCVLIFVGSVAAIDLVLSYFFTGLQNKPSANHPSYTIADSIARGAFFENVTVAPNVIDWNGRRIAIKEAWLEHQTELEQIYVIIPFAWEKYQFRTTEGYNLCLNLSEGGDVLRSSGLFFVSEGKREGFAANGTVIFWERLVKPDQLPRKIIVTDNWKFKNSQTLVLKKTPS